MSDTGTPKHSLGAVRIEILGRTDYMQPEQLAMIYELPDYLRAEGIEPDLYFREPGGMGAPPIETIAMFVGASLASGVVYDLVKESVRATIKGAIAWGRERIRRQPPEGEPLEGRRVSITLYGPKGELLKVVDVTKDDVNDIFTHPSISENITDDV